MNWGTPRNIISICTFSQQCRKKSRQIIREISAYFSLSSTTFMHNENFFKTIHKTFPVIEYLSASVCLFVRLFVWHFCFTWYYRQPAETHTKLEAEKFHTKIYTLHTYTASMITSTIYYYCCVIYFWPDNTFSFIE